METIVAWSDFNTRITRMLIKKDGFCGVLVKDDTMEKDKCSILSVKAVTEASQ